MRQYIDLCKRILNEGVWVENARTGKRCLTIIDGSFEYDCTDGTLPMLTTKQVYWKQAIAEMLGYLRGYTNSQDFVNIGCNTWIENSEAPIWKENPFYKGPGDMGRCYGAQGRDWKNPEGESVDQLLNIYEDLKKGIDNRSEIMTFMNPGERDRACLNSCMHTHTFSILDGYLYLTSYQRSIDSALGLPFNMVQVAWLLMVMAKITGLKPGKAFHKLVNVHLYEDQVDLIKDIQIHREPMEQPKLVIPEMLQTLEDLETWLKPDDFKVVGYKHHPAIAFPFSV